MDNCCSHYIRQRDSALKRRIVTANHESQRTGFGPSSPAGNRRVHTLENLSQPRSRRYSLGGIDING